VSVPQSSDVPDLTARGAAPVSRPFTALLVVVTSTELQNGQAFGATIASLALVMTSALWTVSR
jgi:hypothetical protein